MKTDILKATVSFCFMLAVLVTVILIWGNTPIVTFQFPSGNCLSVDSPRSEHNCENLPARFYTEWRR